MTLVPALHPNVRDLTGQTFGELCVVRFDHREKKAPHKTRMFWFCRCSCGNECVVRGDHLLRGQTSSCGHLQKLTAARLLIAYNQTSRLDYGEGSFNALLTSYHASATTRGLVFELSPSEFRELTRKDCHYCGQEPSQIFGSPSNHGPYIYNGVDRVDNTVGYVRANVVSCCKRCNVAKSDRSLAEFVNWVKRISERMFPIDIPDDDGNDYDHYLYQVGAT